MVDQSSAKWKELIEASKCSSCNGLSKEGYMKMCKQGHLNCDECFKVFGYCKVCKSSEIRDFPFLSKLFDVLPKACRNQGCNFIGWDEDHYKVCEFRSVRCYIIGCSWKEMVHAILDHIGICRFFTERPLEYSRANFFQYQSSAKWKELIEAVKCSSCNELSKDGYMKMCKQGHLNCDECFKVFGYCKICESNEICDFPFLSKLFDALPKACKNQDCNFTGWNEDHYKVCKFRSVPCYILDCSWKGMVHALLDHIGICHPNIPIIENGCCIISSLHQLNQLKECRFVTPLKEHGCLYWKHDRIDYETKIFYSLVQCVPTSSDHLNTISSIKMKKDKVEFAYFRQVYEFDTDENKIFKEVQCFSVPLDMLSYFADEENDVKYTCKILKP